MIEKDLDLGYFMVANSTASVDYLRLAYITALSIKLTQPEEFNQVAIATLTPERVNEFTHPWVFDRVIKFDQRPRGMDARARAYEFTPFKETVFLDSDLLFLNPVDHWWDHMRKHDLYVATRPMTFRNTTATSKQYRKVFVDNDLPDFYSGWLYFKESRETAKFFHVLQALTDYPELWKKQLINCNYLTLPTDEACALTAKMLDIVEDMSDPKLPFPRFTHMKPACQGLGTVVKDWSEQLLFHYDNNLNIKIGPYSQIDILHYTIKNLLSDRFIETLEKKVWNKFNPTL
jgi:hypothetical protein